MRQLFFNLVSNTTKYTMFGSINIRVQVHSSHIELAVIDTGVGINEERKQRLFKMYSEEESSSHSGYGLGLTITKQICEEMHGEIIIKSEEQKGTEVHVLLKPEDIRLIQLDPSDTD